LDYPQNRPIKAHRIARRNAAFTGKFSVGEKKRVVLAKMQMEKKDHQRDDVAVEEPRGLIVFAKLGHECAVAMTSNRKIRRLSSAFKNSLPRR
jgi:hypothetical protein